MKIYLDMCSVQRPLDSRAQPRVAVEAEAILGVIGLCAQGQHTLIASDALVFETERNPHPVRRRHAVEVLAKAGQFVHTDDSVEARARAFHAKGLGALDALHLALAVQGQADYFCTCDDRLARLGRAVETLRTRVVSPLELIAEVTK